MHPDSDPMRCAVGCRLAGEVYYLVVMSVEYAAQFQISTGTAWKHPYLSEYTQDIVSLAIDYVAEGKRSQENSSPQIVHCSTRLTRNICNLTLPHQVNPKTLLLS